MRTKPKPSEMVFIKGPRARLTHLGYTDRSRERSLCGAKLSAYKRYKVTNSGKVTCKGCIKRLKAIQAMIAKLGVEWICEGIWVPLDKRTYQNKINND